MTEFIWVKISYWWALEGLVVSLLSFFLFWLSLIDPTFSLCNRCMNFRAYDIITQV